MAAVLAFPMPTLTPATWAASMRENSITVPASSTTTITTPSPRSVASASAAATIFRAAESVSTFLSSVSAYGLDSARRADQSLVNDPFKESHMRRSHGHLAKMLQEDLREPSPLS
jgi:hypothetical protein